MISCITKKDFTSTISTKEDSQFQSDAWCDETKWNDEDPGAIGAGEGAQEEKGAQGTVCQCCHADDDPHPVHFSAVLHLSLVKERASSCVGPSQWELDLAVPHTTVLTDPDFHGNHCEEDWTRFS